MSSFIASTSSWPDDLVFEQLDQLERMLDGEFDTAEKAEANERFAAEL